MPKRTQFLDLSTFSTFGALLKALRERAGLTQRELARQVGYHYSYLSRLEKNVRRPDEMTLRTRFIPALRIQNDPTLVERFLELAVNKGILEESQLGVDVPVVGSKRGGWLPVSLTPLLGREAECEALFKIFLDDEVRLVTLIGPPGVGKTRLSLHIAEQVSYLFSDGVVFVDLMPVLDAEHVIPAIAAALGAQDGSNASALKIVESALQERNLLLVLDNFEQVLSAAPQLLSLLGWAKEVKILVTSREALRLRGEQEFLLAPLSVPRQTELSVMDFPSVQLFLQRARSARHDFQVDEGNALLAAEICRRLDGLPLAIELAAARVRTFSLKDMLDQFDRRFQWLSNTSRDIPEWRRTLWSTIRWSFNLLNEKEKILFTRLAVFSGGWTVEAAEQICSDRDLPQTEIFELLIALVDRSLVVYEAGKRYRFLDTIAKFAKERLLESGIFDELKCRHLRYFADWAEELEERFYSITPIHYQEYAGVEQNNIHAALEWGLKPQGSFADGVRLANASGLIWLEFGQVRDGYEQVLQYLEKGKDVTSPALYGQLLLKSHLLGNRLGKGKAAYKDSLLAEEVARSIQDKKLLANALFLLGDFEREFRYFDSADRYLTEAVSLYRELDVLPELGQSLSSIGNNFFHLGRREESWKAIDEALRIAERINDQRGLGVALRARATNLRYLGRYKEALSAFENALQVVRVNGDRPNAGVNLVNMCMLTNMMGDYYASAQYALEAVSVFQSLGDVEQQALPKRLRAYALIHLGQLPEAKFLAMESLQINLNAGFLGMGTLPSLLALAEIKYVEGDLECAVRILGFLDQKLSGKFLVTSPDSHSYERLKGLLISYESSEWWKEAAEMELDQVIVKIKI